MLLGMGTGIHSNLKSEILNLKFPKPSVILICSGSASTTLNSISELPSLPHLP